MSVVMAIPRFAYNLPKYVLGLGWEQKRRMRFFYGQKSNVWMRWAAFSWIVFYVQGESVERQNDKEQKLTVKKAVYSLSVSLPYN